MSGVEMRDAREEDEGVRGHCVLGAGFPVSSAIKEPLTALRDPFSLLPAPSPRRRYVNSK